MAAEITFSLDERDESSPSMRHPGVTPVAMVLGAACVVVLWRIARWRLKMDQQYARVQLYEDRPCACRPLASECQATCVLRRSLLCYTVAYDTPGRIPSSAERRELLSSSGATGNIPSACNITSPWGARSTLAALEEDVQETQRLIKDALQDENIPLRRS